MTGALVSSTNIQHVLNVFKRKMTGFHGFLRFADFRDAISIGQNLLYLFVLICHVESYFIDGEAIIHALRKSKFRFPNENLMWPDYALTKMSLAICTRRLVCTAHKRKHQNILPL